MTNTYEMDGCELFAQLADKVARGELLITHFVAKANPMTDRFDIGVRGEIFAAQSPRTTLDMKVTAVGNPTGMPPRKQTIVTMPRQVRELIFDEPDPPPVYDEELG